MEMRASEKAKPLSSKLSRLEWITNCNFLKKLKNVLQNPPALMLWVFKFLQSRVTSKCIYKWIKSKCNLLLRRKNHERL